MKSIPQSLPDLRWNPKSLLSRMRSRFLCIVNVFSVVLCISLAASTTSFAKKAPKPAAAGPFVKIVSVDAIGITVSLGTTGDNHESYKITDETKVTLDGAPINARDLRAGMVASIESSADKKTAITITAKSPPAHPGRHRVG